MNFQKNIQTIPNLPTVVNVKKAELAKRGIADALEWSSHENHVYIGRAMRFVKGVDQTSRWANPFSVERYGRTRCLEMYYEYAKVHLWDALEELAGKELGCWCCPEPCHGDVLARLLQERRNTMG